MYPTPTLIYSSKVRYPTSIVNLQAELPQNCFHIINRFNVSHQIYADDIQLMLVLTPMFMVIGKQFLHALQTALVQKKLWMLEIRLNLNFTKTEFFVILSQINAASYNSGY